jgi:hypothetical protein
LADDAPFALVLRIVIGQTLTDCFAVTNDVVGSEVLEILGLLDGITLAGKGSGCNSRAKASTSLVKEKNLF